MREKRRREERERGNGRGMTLCFFVDGCFFVIDPIKYMLLRPIYEFSTRF